MTRSGPQAETHAAFDSVEQAFHAALDTSLDPRGREIWDDSFLVLFNAHYEPIDFLLPTRRFGVRWASELSTADPAAEPGSGQYSARAKLTVLDRSLVLLRRS